MKTIKITNTSPHILPKYQTGLASGFDFRADLSRLKNNQIHIQPERYTAKFLGYEEESLSVELRPNHTLLIPTGISFPEGLPEGWELQIRGRSSFGFKQVQTHIGTVDADYKAEICVILTNTGTENVWIKDGQRIAQGVFAPILRPDFWDDVGEDKIISTVKNVERVGGFGSTNN